MEILDDLEYGNLSQLGISFEIIQSSLKCATFVKGVAIRVPHVCAHRQRFCWDFGTKP